MFEIDLLKGKGRPRRINLKRAVLRLVMTLIPIGATLAYAAELQNDRNRLETLQQTAAEYEAQLTDYNDAIQWQSQMQRHLTDLSASLEQVGLLLRYRLAVSTALVQIAENLPPEIFIRDIHLRRTGRHERIEDEDSGNVHYQAVVQRSLRLLLCGYEHNDNDLLVQAYLKRLANAPALKPLIHDIRAASREHRELNEKNVMVYEIEVILKDQR